MPNPNSPIPQPNRTVNALGRLIGIFLCCGLAGCMDPDELGPLDTGLAELVAEESIVTEPDPPVDPPVEQVVALPVVLLAPQMPPSIGVGKESTPRRLTAPSASFVGSITFGSPEPIDKNGVDAPLPPQELPPPASPVPTLPVPDLQSVTIPLPPIDDPSWTYQPEQSAPPTRQWIPIQEIEYQAAQLRLFEDRAPLALDIPNLIARTLQNSIRQKQLEIRPSETRQLISLEYGAFDPAVFVASQFDVQNLQQTTEDNRVAFGMRKKHYYGGTLEMNETLGVQDRLAPFSLSDQGIASLNIIYTQELLRDGGKDIALSRGLVASYQYDQSFARSVAESNELVQKTLDAYWQLYRARANYFIQYALTEVAYQLIQQIEDRNQLVERSLNSLEQARALFLEARADLVNAQTRVLQAQDVLYRLVNDPELDPRFNELITAEGPMNGIAYLDPIIELSLAFQNRPEVRERIAAIRENAVTLQVSLNQLLPRLSVALRSSLNGFDNNRDYLGALNNLSDQPLSGAAIANFEMFLNNRTARSKNKEAQLRASRLYLEYEDQLQAVREEVLVALRLINNATPEISLRTETLLAREREIDAVTARIWVNPEEGVSMVLQLDQLFQAINRLVRTQQQLIDAKVQLQTSLVSLQRAKGSLVSVSAIPPNNSVPIPRPIRALGEQFEGKHPINEQIQQRVLQEPLPN